jgi:acyl carrier protein
MKVDKQALYAFLGDEFGLDAGEIADDTLLFSSGMIDSFSLVSLITWLEEQYGFRMNPMDVNLDNLDSVQLICSFVERVSG